MHFLTTADSERAGIEMIYQEISLHPDLSVAENIFLGKLPGGVALVRGLEEDARRKPQSLGTGRPGGVTPAPRCARA